jgi:hypothetical protein
LTRLQSIGLQCDDIGNRVTDKSPFNTVLGQQIRLERVDAQHMVDAGRHGRVVLGIAAAAGDRNEHEARAVRGP